MYICACTNLCSDHSAHFIMFVIYKDLTIFVICKVCEEMSHSSHRFRKTNKGQGRRTAKILGLETEIIKYLDSRSTQVTLVAEQLFWTVES